MALTTYTAVGNREDLSDIITTISPDTTPLYSMIGRTKATAVQHDWLEDELRPPKDNAMVEGASYTVEDPTPRERKSNVTQIFTQGYGVSRTQEVVLKAGVKSEIAYQMAKAMKEVARDVEYAYINNGAPVLGDATTTPRKLGGLDGMITTNVVDAASGSLTEDMFNDAIQLAWEAGGEPNVALVSGSKKRTISSFTAGSMKTVSAQDKILVKSVDVYESDFGLVKVIADRYMPNDKVYILSKEYLKTAYLDPFHKVDIAKTKDAIEKVIRGELTLEVRAEKAHAKIINLA